MVNATDDYIQKAVSIAGLSDYMGSYHLLGSGEVNTTYLLDCGKGKVVLRMAKHPDWTTLANEAWALGLLTISNVPQLVYFNPEKRINGSLWIMESFVEGAAVTRLTINQWNTLGKLLARIHQTTHHSQDAINVWKSFVATCTFLGGEEMLLRHPDKEIQHFIHKAQRYCHNVQSLFAHVTPTFIHADATPSNMLIRGNAIALVDWENAKFMDPMAEFAAIYYEDLEYNHGKWRIYITPQERATLFEGYTAAGGTIDSDRIAVWMNLDKIGAVVYLYWRLYQSNYPMTTMQKQQYTSDYHNIMKSIAANLPNELI